MPIMLKLVLVMQSREYEDMSGNSDNLVLCENCGQYETTSPRRVCWRCLEQDMIDNAEPPGPIDWSAWDAEYLEDENN